jgi:acetyl esterase/lipase
MLPGLAALTSALLITLASIAQQTPTPPVVGLVPGMLPATPPGSVPWSVARAPTHADISYGDGSQQRLDLYLPERRGGAPVVLLLHGGAWTVGDKTDYGPVGDQLARNGAVVALVNYRLSPAVQHPAHAQDVAAAVAWLYRHATEYGGDPARLTLIGHSSGAHLAALVALDPSYLADQGLTAAVIQRVVGIAGAGYDLDARYATTPLAAVLNTVFGTDSSQWALAAPLRYVTGSALRFYLLHGLNDTSAPAASTQVFAAALQEAGVPTQLDLLPGQDHTGVVIAALPLIHRLLQD